MRKIHKLFLVLLASMLAPRLPWAGNCYAESTARLNLPDYMDVIVGNQTPRNETQSADQAILDLDLAMFGIYDDALAKSKANFLSQHPIIMALFSNEGGKLLLYRPGMPPEEASQVPIQYQIYKSVGHSALAVFELAGSHLGTQTDKSWLAPMRAFRGANQSALDSLASSSLDASHRKNEAKILEGNIQFMNACLSKGSYTFTDIQAYAREIEPFLQLNVHWGATIQVEHWMQVMKAWKESLGSQWNQTYGVSNTLYVARQNNVLFSVLAQFFGKDGMNKRLFLFETPEFVTTPDKMLDVLIRTVSDRSVGMVFFGNYYLMDYELMGGDARKAIAAEDQKYGLPVFLPPLVPFESTEWPFRTDPKQGHGPALIEQIK